MSDKLCLECGEPLLGRADKKFCSDQCRNTFNNRMNSDSINLVRNINNQLRKNRRILTELNPEGKTKVHKDKLLSKGFSFKYSTHSYTTQKGTTYFFIYDQGYLTLEDGFYFLVVDKRLLDK
ncbi:MAG: hypothetical protein AB7V36_11575 [Bacteroidales bacterium]|jgi:predicted nucleic acid-binding Zn ribbon protein|nr:hypothetical protein [Bacteroidales bacterium]NCC74419.1 hypothetical protein [Sphingobacteriia bacterium]